MHEYTQVHLQLVNNRNERRRRLPEDVQSTRSSTPSYSGVKTNLLFTPEKEVTGEITIMYRIQKHPHSLEWHNGTIKIDSTIRNELEAAYLDALDLLAQLADLLRQQVVSGPLPGPVEAVVPGHRNREHRLCVVQDVRALVKHRELGLY